jgi:hypothetical protein
MQAGKWGEGCGALRVEGGDAVRSVVGNNVPFFLCFLSLGFCLPSATRPTHGARATDVSPMTHTLTPDYSTRAQPIVAFGDGDCLTCWSATVPTLRCGDRERRGLGGVDRGRGRGSWVSGGAGGMGGAGGDGMLLGVSRYVRNIGAAGFRKGRASGDAVRSVVGNNVPFF